MTHIPAVDPLELLREIHAIVYRPPTDRARLDYERDGRDLRALLPKLEAALARPAGGSERLREDGQSALWALRQIMGDMRNCDNWDWLDPAVQRVANELVARNPCATLASPQGAEQRQEMTVAWLVADLRNEGFDAEASMIEGLAAECAAEPHNDTPGMAPALFNRLANGMREFATPHPEPAATQGDNISRGAVIEPGMVACISRHDTVLLDGTYYPTDQIRAALSSPPGVQAAQVSDAPELTRLRELAGCLYAGPAAVHDLPEHWLDTLLAASEGSPFSCDELLPYVAAAPYPWHPIDEQPPESGRYIIAHRGTAKITHYLHPKDPMDIHAKSGWQINPAEFGATVWMALPDVDYQTGKPPVKRAPREVIAEMRARATNLHSKGYFVIAGDLRTWADALEATLPAAEPIMCDCHDETQRRLCVMRDKCCRPEANSQQAVKP